MIPPDDQISISTRKAILSFNKNHFPMLVNHEKWQVNFRTINNRKWTSFVFLMLSLSLYYSQKDQKKNSGKFFFSRCSLIACFLLCVCVFDWNDLFYFHSIELCMFNPIDERRTRNKGQPRQIFPTNKKPFFLLLLLLTYCSLLEQRISFFLSLSSRPLNFSLCIYSGLTCFD